MSLQKFINANFEAYVNFFQKFSRNRRRFSFSFFFIFLLSIETLMDQLTSCLHPGNRTRKKWTKYIIQLNIHCQFPSNVFPNITCVESKKKKMTLGCNQI